MKEVCMEIAAQNRLTAMSDVWGIPVINKRINCSFILSYTKDSGKFILQYDLDCDGVWWIMEQFWDFPYFEENIEDFPESIVSWKGYCKINKKGDVFWKGVWNVKYLEELWKK